MNQVPLVRTDDAGTVYFLSDVHLGGSEGPAELRKQHRLEAFLDLVAAEKASLYILGDLFDFWFEYRHAIPKTGFRALARLEALTRGGTPVFYLGGNHDFWMSDFLERETGLTVLPDGVRLEAQGRAIRMVHGDGLGPGDNGYKLLKRITRNPLAIRMFRWIHPDVGIGFALWLSHLGRSCRGEDEARANMHGRVDEAALYRNVARPLMEDGSGTVLMGHHHKPVHMRGDEGEMLILGNWFLDYTCARLTGGELELLQWSSTDDHVCMFTASEA